MTDRLTRVQYAEDDLQPSGCSDERGSERGIRYFCECVRCTGKSKNQGIHPSDGNRGKRIRAF